MGAEKTNKHGSWRKFSRAFSFRRQWGENISQKKEVNTSNAAGKSSGTMELTNMWVINDFRDTVVLIVMRTELNCIAS